MGTVPSEAGGLSPLSRYNGHTRAQFRNLTREHSVIALMNTELPVSSVPWNTFLALIPIALAYVMLWVYRGVRPRAIRNTILCGLGIAWLAFLPNTCYLLTEWRHFMDTVDMRNLYLQSKYDKTAFMQLCVMTMFYTAYSGVGILAFALAIRPIEKLAKSAGATIWFWGLPFFVAMSLGVYLGLVLRFNSWDILQRPNQVWAEFAAIGGRPVLGLFIVAFGLLLWALYESVDIWVDALAERWSVLTGRRIHLGPKPGDGQV